MGGGVGGGGCKSDYKDCFRSQKQKNQKFFDKHKQKCTREGFQILKKLLDFEFQLTITKAEVYL
jgi:hypothetical protein